MINELLVLKFYLWKSKSKELLELGLEVYSLYKKRVNYIPFDTSQVRFLQENE